MSLWGLGGVFSARRTASSRRRAVSASLYSFCCVLCVGVRGMPLLLSQVKPDATVTLWGPMLNPYIGVPVANIIALSARVDHELSLLLVHILGAKARAAHAMFDAIRSNQLKMQVLVAAANTELKTEPEKHLAFRAVLKAADIAQEDRNKVAHWLWGSAPELPDALLLANPAFVRLQNIEQLRLSQNVESLAKFLS